MCTALENVDDKTKDFCACFIFLERGFDFDNDKKGVSEHQSDSQTTFAPAAAIIDG